MRFGVICIYKDNHCTIVADGEYSELIKIIDKLSDKYKSGEIRLIETDKESYIEIKDDIIELDKKFTKFFKENELSDYSSDSNYWET